MCEVLTMDCQNCHLPSQNEWMFCPRCGKLLERMIKCRRCSTKVEGRWKYCHGCGMELAKSKPLLDSEVVEQVVENRLTEKGKQRDKREPDQTAGIWQQFTGIDYGAGVRSQVFEVIVRQAMAGAPWQQICRGPMEVNKITVEEVEREVNRRRAAGDWNFPRIKEELEFEVDEDDDKDDEGPGLHTAPVPKKPLPPDKGETIKLPLPEPEEDDD